MEFGLIGLGKMGSALARQAAEKGHDLVVFNRTVKKAESLHQEIGIRSARTITELIESLTPPRIIWLMIPAGKPVDDTIASFKGLLQEGDLVIDGGNSFYKDSKRRSEELSSIGVSYLDIGVSGGISGAREGACMMAGGPKDAYEKVEPVLKSLCVKDGYGYMGPSGSGHFVKMVHNGIEYGMMQAMGEGYQLLQASEYDLSYETVSKVWANGSVIRGWLMDLLLEQFSHDPNLKDIPSEVGQSGEGLWTLQEALHHHVSMPAISAAIFRRFDSKEKQEFSIKVIQALRKGFGGHDAQNRIPQ